MGTRTSVVAALAVCVALAGVHGCKKEEGPAERAGRQIDKAADKAGREVEKAGQAIQDAARGKK